MGDAGEPSRLEAGSGRGYTAVMTSWFGPRSLILAALWAVLSVALAFMVIPTAGAGWPSYAAAVGILGLYVATCAAFVRDRRQKRRWT